MIKASPMENEPQKSERMSLKPNAFDMVLEVIAGLLLLFLWGIALGSFIFPESYTDRFHQIPDILIAFFASLAMVWHHREIRFPFPVKDNFLVKITEENAERQQRFSGRMSQFFLIFIFVIVTSGHCKYVIPLESISGIVDFFYSDHYFMWFIILFLIWYYVRSWMLR